MNEHFIVSLKNYLLANDGKINPDRKIVFNYYSRGEINGNHWDIVQGRTVLRVRVTTNKNVIGFEEPEGKKHICPIDNAHVEMPLSFLNEFAG